MSLTRIFAVAFQSLRRSPGFAIAVVAILALATLSALTTGELVDAAMLRPLPIAEPGSLVSLRWRAPSSPNGPVLIGAPGLNASSLFPLAALRDLSALGRKSQPALKGVFGYAPSSFLPQHSLVRYGAQTVLVDTVLVSAGFFADLGLKPSAGRLLSAGDYSPRAPASAVLSYSLWVSLGSPAAAGRAISVDRVPYTVVGVGPKGFRGLRDGFQDGLWIPLANWPGLHPSMASMGMEREAPATWWLAIFARTRRGHAGEAQSVASAFWASHRNRYGLGSDAGNISVDLAPADGGLGEVQHFLAAPAWPSLAAALLVMLMALAGAGLLLWARAVHRRSEFAVRLAVGAPPSSLVALALADIIILAITACAVAAAAAPECGRVLASMISGPASGMGFHLIAAVPAALPAGVVAFVLGLALLSGVPAARAAAGSGIAVVANSRGPAMTGAGPRRRLNGLLVAQLAFALVVIAAAVVFGRTLTETDAARPPYDPRGVMLVTIDPGRAGYHGASESAYIDRVLRAIAASPGTSAVTASSMPLVSSYSEGSEVSLLGAARSKPLHLALLAVGPDFARTLRIPILRSRGLSWADQSSGSRLVLLTQSAAELLSIADDPIGRRLSFQFPVVPGKAFAVAGIVPDMKAHLPEALVLYGSRGSMLAQSAAFGVTVEARVRGNASTFAQRVRGLLRRIDPAVPIARFGTQQGDIEAASGPDRFAAYLAAALAILALLLACVSVGAIQAHNVGIRTREVGLRIAMGATTLDVVAQTLGPALLASAAGLFVGLCLSMAADKVARAWQVGIPQIPLSALAVAAVLLVASTAGATAVPLARAMRIGPAAALRDNG